MTLATTVSLAVLRGPVSLAKTLAALDVLSDGRLIAGIGPGSSKRDYDALGVSFDERWNRFDEAIAALPRCSKESLVQGGRITTASPRMPNSRRVLDTAAAYLSGSAAGARTPDCAGWRVPERLARLRLQHDADRFAEARERLARELEGRGRDAEGFPNALATMWTWVAKDRTEGDRTQQRPSPAPKQRSRRASRPAVHRPG